MTPKELAAAIRKGHTMIGEDRIPYFGKSFENGLPCGCALGAALAGTGHVAKNNHEFFGVESIAKTLSIDEGLARAVSNKHYKGMPRLEIADWLDTLDVSKPKDAQTFESFMKVVTQPVELETACAR